MRRSVRIRRWLGPAALAAGLGLAASLAAGPPPQTPRPPSGSAARAAGSAAAAPGPLVYLIPVRGVIELGLAPFVARSLEEAERRGARAAILELETPGGRLDAAERIVDAVREAQLPTYAFVNYRAFSAGAFVALAADRIFMRPGALLGAATPVTAEGTKAPEKIVSALRAEMRALAEERGLDPRIAEAMVDEDIEIPGLSPRGKLLTLTTAQAVRVGYAEEVADHAALLARLGLAGATVHRAEINWAEALVRFLTHPLVAPLLLSLGLLGLVLELKTPSFGLAGVAGLTLLALFFGSHTLVGLAGWEELLLLAAGLVLLGVEIFVVPGFGVFGIAGIVAVLASIYLSLVGRFATGGDFGQAAGALSAALLFLLVTAWTVLRSLPRSRRLARAGILLRESTAPEAGYRSAAPRTDLVGATGTTLTDLHPVGIAQFGEERLDVVAESGWIPAGTSVRIVRAEGYRHVVRPAE